MAANMSTPRKTRLEGLVSNVAIKAPVEVATTGPIVLEGTPIIDSYQTKANDRVLVNHQANKIENGIYDVCSGPWVRAQDFSGNRDAVTGTLVQTKHGTSNAPTTWRLTTVDPITIGSSLIEFEPVGITMTDGSNLFITAAGGNLARTAADRHGDLADGGWVAPNQVVYVAANQYTVQNDGEQRHSVGRRVRALGSLTGEIEGSISARVGDLVTVDWDGGASLSNEALIITLSVNANTGVETVSGTVTLSVLAETSYLDAGGGAVTATLPDGRYAGQRKYIKQINGTATSIVTVTNHIVDTNFPLLMRRSGSGPPEEAGSVLRWNGTKWETIAGGAGQRIGLAPAGVIAGQHYGREPTGKTARVIQEGTENKLRDFVQNVESLRINSGGGISSWAFGSIGSELEIPHEGVFEIPLGIPGKSPDRSGLMFFHTPEDSGAHAVAMIYYQAQTPRIELLVPGSAGKVAVSTLTLTGTTGAAGMITISANKPNDRLYFENQIGVPVKICVLFMGQGSGMTST